VSPAFFRHFRVSVWRIFQKHPRGKNKTHAIQNKKTKRGVLFVPLPIRRGAFVRHSATPRMPPKRQPCPFLHATLKMDPNDEISSTQTKAFRLAFRLSEEEKKELQTRADSAATGLSNYARQKLLEGKTISMTDETQAQLKGMAINLNQIARKVNASGQVPGELSELILKINQVLSDAYRQR